MNRTWMTLAVSGIVLSLGMGISAIIVRLAPPFVRNTSGSMPVASYPLAPIPATLPTGAIVVACAPGAAQLFERLHLDSTHPYCRDGGPLLLKHVIASAGAHVRVTDKGVWIDGRLIANSAPLERLRDGTVLPRPATPLTIPQGEVWLWSPAPASLDSRYFGPLRPLALAIGTLPIPPPPGAR